MSNEYQFDFNKQTAKEEQNETNSPQSESKVAANKNFCSNCGTKLNEGDIFCGNCGCKIETPQNNLVNASNNSIEFETQKIPSDKWAWTMACVPILGTFLSAFIFGLFQYYISIDIISIIVFIAMNTIFVLQDKSELEKNGIDVDSWIWLGFFLIPVYLFIRAGNTNKKYGYAITWCITFFISLFL